MDGQDEFMRYPWEDELGDYPGGYPFGEEDFLIGVQDPEAYDITSSESLTLVSLNEDGEEEGDEEDFDTNVIAWYRLDYEGLVSLFGQIGAQ